MRTSIDLLLSDRPTPNDLYRAAQALIRSGQPVFPCRSTPTVVNGREVGAKAPMIKNGLHAATRDVSQVKTWWRRHGDAAIGIPTGIVWDVLDVDTKESSDGRVHLPKLRRLGLLNGCKFVVKTPSGGWHLYFKAAPAGALTNKAHALLGLDVRSHGGYVLAPPSWIDDQEKSVGHYALVGETTGSTDEPLMWDLIVKSLAPINEDTRKPIELLGYERQASVASLKGWLSERQPGERNNALHWAVCRCIDNGIDPNELAEVALLLGLSDDEVNLTINSALRRAGVSLAELDTEAEAMFGRD
jgi:hypothetical protein